MPHPNQNGSKRGANSNGSSEKKEKEEHNKREGQASELEMTTDDFREHLEVLQGVSHTASQLFSLLRNQITSLSYVIPLQRGHEMVADLKARAKSQRDSLETAFGPILDHIEQIKAGFWTKHGEMLEAKMQKYIRQKIEDRVKNEVNKQLKRYVEYLKNNKANTTKLKEAAEVSHARFQNSLLSIKYPAEPVVWIGDLPDGVGPTMTFGELVRADNVSVVNMAKSLGLSPAQEDDHLTILNQMMRHLGIAYKGLPSCAGVLLMPTKTSL